MALLKNPCIALQMCNSNYHVTYYIEKSTNVNNLKYHSPCILQQFLPLKIQAYSRNLLPMCRTSKHVLHDNHNTQPSNTINMQLNNISHF